MMRPGPWADVALDTPPATCESRGVPFHSLKSPVGAAFAALVSAAVLAQSPGTVKALPVAGEVFAVAGHTSFLILPPEPARTQPLPWVFYAPTLPGLPEAAEQWMFERFLAAGIAIAGIDVGESYGSPAGRELYSALHAHLVAERGLARKACLLARSRGGLMLYNWAAEHADSVACIAGIYPVCDLASWPGLVRACGAYGMTEGELAASLRDHNPIDRLAPLAQAGVPIFHIHGDDDRVVPLARNSAVVQQRYAELGGTMVLEIVPGGGHDMARAWFESRRLVDFVIDGAKAAAVRTAAGTTRGILEPNDTRRPEGAVQLVGPEGSRMVPEKAGAECLWVFADGVLTASPAWDSVVTPEPYRDFRLHVEFNVNEAPGADPEARGNSGVYLQERYELQILDSYGVAAADYKASYCGSLYRLKQPDRLACRPAGEWQTYDVVFRAARYDGDTKVEDARITALHNGQLIHDDFAIPRKTGAGAAEGPAPRPIKLQGHHNPVRFRNVWIRELDLGGRERR